MTNDPNDPWRGFPFGPGGPFGRDPFGPMDEWFKSMGVDPSDFRRIFDEMQRSLHDAFKQMGEDPSKGFVAGFNVRMGPDGKPHISSFGNKPHIGPRPSGGVGLGVDEREPLTDVIEDPRQVAITMELPGVAKEDIDIKMTPDRLDVGVDNERRKYHKSVRLPAKVDPRTTKATYKNGILDVTVQKVQPDEDTVTIDVE